MYCRSIIKRLISLCIVLSLALALGVAAWGWNPAVALADAQPDLTVTDITLFPSNPAIGDTVTITVTIKNKGAAPSLTSYCVCYIDDAILATNSISGLAAGTSTTTAFTWQVKGGSPVIRAIADSAGFISESDETNNTMSFTLTPLAADLIVQSITWSPSNPSKGDSIVFTITVKNQGNARSRATRLNFYIDGSSRGFQDVFPIDPGSTSSHTYPWVAQSGQHAVKAVVDEAHQVQESNESNNEYSLTFSTLPPDLVVKSLTWTPTNPSKNDVVTFTANVTNQGRGGSDACHLGYYIDGVYRSILLVEPLEPGASCNVTFDWTAEEQIHEVKVVVDFDKIITESDENNNVFSTSFQTLLPDLTVTEVTWLPVNAGVGDTVTFTATVKNLGTGRAEPFRVACYVSGSYSGYADVTELDAGVSVNSTFEWPAANGVYVVHVVADCDFTLTESAEDNNDANRSISIIPADIFVRSISCSPENPAIGDIVTFSTNITNLGGGASGSFYIAYYLDDELLSYDNLPYLGAGANATSTYQWTAENGRHIFKAVADYDKRVPESNENNNESEITVVPLMPDIAVGAVTWQPADMPVGSEITFTIDIENQGKLRAGPFRVAYYVDGAVTGYTDIDLLEAGAKAIGRLPWTAASGAHSIKIVADTNDQVFELDENNNTKTISIPLPDLIVTDLTWSPAQASIGDNVTFTATVNNQGGGPTQPARIIGYVDGRPVAYDDLPEIPPAGSVTGSFVFVAAAGTHDFRVFADIDNRVTESDETNNDKTTRFATLTPDLVVGDISWSMENSLMSDAATILITVKNQGTDISGNAWLTCLIDGTSAANQEIAPIPAGGSLTLTISPRLKSGSHKVDVAVDTAKQVVELDETNNAKTFSFSTVTSDLVIKAISWSPQAEAGDKIVINVTVENQGKLKTDKTRLALQIGDSPAQYADIHELNMGAVETVDFSWDAVAGPQVITASADIDGTLLESNENNNTYSRTISLSVPEATVTEPVVDLSSPENDKGFLANFWWALLLGAILLAGGAFALTLKSFLKK